MVCTLLMHVHMCMYQVLLISLAIDAAAACSHLYKLPYVGDPSNDIVELLIQCMNLNIASRKPGIPESELPELLQKAIILLDLLQKISLTRLGERPCGILKRFTVFCTRSAKLCCGETRIAPRVKHQK